MVYQSIADLKEMRKILGLTKEAVADNIGYSVRTLERIERRKCGFDRKYCKEVMSVISIKF